MSETTDQKESNGFESGRKKDGTFGPGHKFARGSPYARKVKALRAQIVRFLDRGKIWDIAEMLFTEAIEKKNVIAAKELLDRGLGKATQPVELNDNETLSAVGALGLATYFSRKGRQAVDAHANGNGLSGEQPLPPGP